MSAVLVADVSDWQDAVSVGAIARTCHGLYHKLTEGTTYVAHYAAPRHAAAAAERLPFGLYHFAEHDKHAPDDEARHFLSALHVLAPHGLGGIDLLPMLDMEEGNAATAGAWAAEFNAAVFRELGVWPLFYSYPDYIARMRLRRPIGNGLWLSSFSRNDGADHPYMIPAPWRKVRLHQFTSAGVLNGVRGRVDLSHGLRLPFAHPMRAAAHASRVAGAGRELLQ